MRPSSETYNDPSETNMPLIFQDLITENDLIDHPDRLYLFGDNELCEGRAGQARVCRGHPNAVGVATK